LWLATGFCVRKRGIKHPATDQVWKTFHALWFPLCRENDTASQLKMCFNSILNTEERKKERKEGRKEGRKDELFKLFISLESTHNQRLGWHLCQRKRLSIRRIRGADDGFEALMTTFVQRKRRGDAAGRQADCQLFGGELCSLWTKSWSVSCLITTCIISVRFFWFCSLLMFTTYQNFYLSKYISKLHKLNQMSLLIKAGQIIYTYDKK